MANISSDKLQKLTEQIKAILTIVEGFKDEQSLKIIKPFKGPFGVSQKFGENPKLYEAYGFAGHFGIDFLTPWSTEILAVDDGEVSRAGVSEGDGFYIEIKHKWGYTYYCHFKQPVTFLPTMKVTKGQIIGYAGNTGRVFSDKPLTDKYRGTHLHFSMKINGVSNPNFKDWIDPAPFFEN